MKVTTTASQKKEIRAAPKQQTSTKLVGPLNPNAGPIFYHRHDTSAPIVRAL